MKKIVAPFLVLLLLGSFAPAHATIEETSQNKIRKWNILLGAGIGGLNYLGKAVFTSDDFRFGEFSRYVTGGAIGGGVIYEAKKRMGEKGYNEDEAWKAHALSAAGGSIGRNIVENGYTGFWHNYAIDLGPIWLRADLRNGRFRTPLVDWVSLAAAASLYSKGSTIESFDGGYLHFRAKEPGPLDLVGTDGNFAGVTYYNVIELTQSISDNPSASQKSIVEHERIHAMQLSHDYLSPLGATSSSYEGPNGGIVYYGWAVTGPARLYDNFSQNYNHRWQEREAKNLADLGEFSE